MLYFMIVAFKFSINKRLHSIKCSVQRSGHCLYVQYLSFHLSYTLMSYIALISTFNSIFQQTIKRLSPKKKKKIKEYRSALSTWISCFFQETLPGKDKAINQLKKNSLFASGYFPQIINGNKSLLTLANTCLSYKVSSWRLISRPLCHRVY